LVSADLQFHEVPEVPVVDAARIAHILGGERVLRARVRSLRDLERAIQRGLPKRSLVAAVERIATDPGERNELIARIVPTPTFRRRRTVLKPAESERTERFARVIALAEDVWGDQAQARRFLKTPHPLLESRRPLDVARTELGARQVEELLLELLHGLAV
jgi:putative toxin-antitoxin system antitoxin component (TIGR02293 family)